MNIHDFFLENHVTYFIFQLEMMKNQIDSTIREEGKHRLLL